MRNGTFPRSEMVCTKTLYNYVDLGLLPIKNIDLPEKLRRNTKAKKARENRKILGQSIEERPEIVKFRTEFGHWEIDTVIGKKDENEPCVLTLVERMTRMCIWVKGSQSYRRGNQRSSAAGHIVLRGATRSSVQDHYR